MNIKHQSFVLVKVVVIHKYVDNSVRLYFRILVLEGNKTETVPKTLKKT